MATLNDILKNKKPYTPKTRRAWDNFEKPVKKEKDSENILKNSGANTGNYNHDNEGLYITSDSILELDTSLFTLWEYKERQGKELGDIDLLATKLKEVGQLEHCTARPSKKESGKYELITGERRWHAAKKVGLKLRVLIKDMTDIEASVHQYEENNKGSTSDFLKGMCFAKQIGGGAITQKTLAEQHKMSKQKISAFLSFSKIPQDISDTIGDMKKVSSKTAEKIKQLSTRGQEYIDAIKEKADLIRSGSMGHSSLEKQVLLSVKRINKPTTINLSKKVYTPTGRHIFTWRTDNNGIPSIHFPKNIANLLTNEKLNLSNISNRFLSIIDNELNVLNEEEQTMQNE